MNIFKKINDNSRKNWQKSSYKGKVKFNDFNCTNENLDTSGFVYEIQNIKETNENSSISS